MVHAEDNLQALSYLVLATELWGTISDEPITQYRVTIVQPRSFTSDSVDTWCCTPDRVADHRRDVIAALTRHDLKVGDWCQFCPAILVCPEQQRMSLVAAERPDADTLSSDQLVFLHKNRSRIRKFLDLVEDELLRRMQTGEVIPGYKATLKMSNLNWTHKPGDVLDELQTKGVPLSEVTKLVTPTQVKKAGYGDLIEDFCDRVPSGYSVVPESSRGEPVLFKAPAIQGD